MKKFLALIGMLTCIFGLAACGGENTLTEYEQEKVNVAVSRAQEVVIPCIDEVLASPDVYEFSEYTAEELEYTLSYLFGIDADGYAFMNALDSFASAYEKTGKIGAVTDTSAVIDDDQIIVTVTLEGANQNADAEIVFSNDFFLRLKSASLNPVSTFGDAMAKAGLNTLLGMGTVFAVLILICLIISCFGVIPKIQKMFAGKREEDLPVAEKKVSASVAAAQAADESDDLELVAVIAAAIAASEGAASTDGFVVRSIRRRKLY